MSNEPERGELRLEHYDRAIFQALDADFLPFPDPDGESKLPDKLRQARIEGINGPGYVDRYESDGRIPTVYNYPEDVYNRYLLPGIRVKRSTGLPYDDNRRFGKLSGYKYRVPSSTASKVTVDGQEGFTHYTHRPHAEPHDITYQIEVRSRYNQEALRMRRYVIKHIQNRMFLEVFDSEGVPGYFTVFKESDSEVSEMISSLDRYAGFQIEYRVEAEIDVQDEYEERAMTSSVNLENESIEESNS